MKEKYITPTEARKIIENMGFKHKKNMVPSTCIVNLVEKNGEERILKMARYNKKIGNWMLEHIEQESKILDEFKGIHGIPQKITYHSLEGQSKNKNEMEGQVFVNPYILEKEYIEGVPYTNQTIGLKAKKIIKNIVNIFHKKGYADLDLKKRNLIYTPNGELSFVDIGNAKKIAKEEILKKAKKIDLKNLESLFE